MYSSQATSLVIAAVILVLLATVAVALRFKVRSNVKTGRGPDDWIILGALVSRRGAICERARNELLIIHR